MHSRISLIVDDDDNHRTWRGTCTSTNHNQKNKKKIHSSSALFPTFLAIHFSFSFSFFNNLYFPDIPMLKTTVKRYLTHLLVKPIIPDQMGMPRLSFPRVNITMARETDFTNYHVFIRRLLMWGFPSNEWLL